MGGPIGGPKQKGSLAAKAGARAGKLAKPKAGKPDSPQAHVPSPPAHWEDVEECEVEAKEDRHLVELEELVVVHDPLAAVAATAEEQAARKKKKVTSGTSKSGSSKGKSRNMLSPWVAASPVSSTTSPSFR